MSRGPLLDTHAWVWWVHGDKRLGRAALQALDALGPDQRPAICDISLWEVATLVARGRLHLDMPLAAWLDLAADPRTVRVLPITRQVVLELHRLGDALPRDPADRLIIATSRAENRPLLTRDDTVRKSGLARLWKADGPATGFEDQLPRLFELRASLRDPGHPEAYFQDLESNLQNEHVFDSYARVERHLAELDERAWHDLRDRATAKLIARQREDGRGWQDLFDVLNEAVAYGYLVAMGATNIQFVSAESEQRTPDLSATLDQRSVLCEVKSINKSDVQAKRDRRVAAGEVKVTKSMTQLPPQWLTKFEGKIADALDQLRAGDGAGSGKRVVFIAIGFDDRLGDYHDRYFSQLDEFLDTIDLLGAELVLYPTTNFFERTYVMRNATVFIG